MRSFRLLAVAALVAVFILIFLGGLVRVSGAGLGCPDWPKCFGSWVPPVSIDQLPREFDPSTFNFTLAWIEYFNRLFGMATGLLIAVVAVLAIVSYRQIKGILIPSVLAALLVAYQGWQGGQVVMRELEPVLVSTHFVLALIIAALLVLVVQRSYYEDHPEERSTRFPILTRGLVVFVGILTVGQIVLGTHVRAQIEDTQAANPLVFGSDLLAYLEGMFNLHMTLGIIAVAAVWFVSFKIVGGSKDVPPLLNQVVWALIGMSFVQILVGLGMYILDLPPVMKVLHLWTAAVIFALLIATYRALSTKPREA